MHGEDGPGEAWNTATPVDDAIVEADMLPGEGLRQARPLSPECGLPGPGLASLGGGYLVGVGPYSGAIDDLAKRLARQERQQGSRRRLSSRVARRRSGRRATSSPSTPTPRPESDRDSAWAPRPPAERPHLDPAAGDSGIWTSQQIAMAALCPRRATEALLRSPPPPPPAPTATATPGDAGALRARGSIRGRDRPDARSARPLLRSDSSRTDRYREAASTAALMASGTGHHRSTAADDAVPRRSCSLTHPTLPAVQGYRDAQSKAQVHCRPRTAAQAIAAQTAAAGPERTTARAAGQRVHRQSAERACSPGT